MGQKPSSEDGSTSTDPFIIVGITILLLIIFVINVYILVYWQHPQEKNESYIARFLILMSLCLSAMTVLVIPIDIANNSGAVNCSMEVVPKGTYCGGLDMYSAWQALFSMVCFFVVVFIPFATFYYESSGGIENEGKCNFPFCTALIYESILVVSFLALILSLYYTSSGTNIPVAEFSLYLEDAESILYDTDGYSSPYDFVDMHIPAYQVDLLSSEIYKTNTTNWYNEKTEQYVKFNVNFAIYLIGMFGFCGWWLFSVFAGVGLTSIPADLICEFLWRPKVMAPDEQAQKELEIQERTAEMLDISVMLKKDRQVFLQGNPSRGEKSKRSVADQLELNRLTQMVYILERDIEEYRASKNVNQQYNPLIPIFKLALGVVCAFLSIIWITHILMYMLISPPKGPFLNTYLIGFDQWFPMFGNLTYALFSLYLLFCTIKGCFKIGLRFLCIKIHPMEVGKTYINAFLFNLAIILFCTIPVVHFCTWSLSGYTRNSDAYLIFMVQVYNLHFYNQFYEKHIFAWIIVLVMLLMVPYLLWRPREVAPSTEEFKMSLHRRGAGSGGTGGGSSGAMDAALKVAKTSAAKYTKKSSSG
jgi:LMBR1 domain-containing protein 1